LDHAGSSPARRAICVLRIMSDAFFSRVFNNEFCDKIDRVLDRSQKDGALAILQRIHQEFPIPEVFGGTHHLYLKNGMLTAGIWTKSQLFHVTFNAATEVLVAPDPQVLQPAGIEAPVAVLPPV
jgi:hypothetical protein